MTDSGGLLWRDRASRLLVVALGLPALLLPAGVLLYLIGKGLGALNPDLFFGLTGGSGGAVFSSGIIGPMAGSVALAVGACGLAFPFALGLACFNVLEADSLPGKLAVTILQVMQGIPPIVYGLCGLLVFVHLAGWGISLLAGMIILAVIILPLLTLNIQHAFERIPFAVSQTAQSLGLSQLRVITHVWLPASWPGLLTGMLLAVARSLTETAPILFTATVFYGVVWPDSLFQPVTTLQTHIFYLAQEGVNPAILDRAWGSALVLVLLVGLVSLSATGMRYWERQRNANEN